MSIILTLTTVGLRNLQDVGFAGGLLTILMGLWTFYAIWGYGSEIAEKFYVSPDRAVRGPFVYGPDGTSMRWKNTPQEEAAAGIDRSGFACFKKKWRPDGHGVMTPLWRLDKMIAFPYHDEKRT